MCKYSEAYNAALCRAMYDTTYATNIYVFFSGSRSFLRNVGRSITRLLLAQHAELRAAFLSVAKNAYCFKSGSNKRVVQTRGCAPASCQEGELKHQLPSSRTQDS